MLQALIFVLVVCLALGCFAWAGDAWATYEHNLYLIEAERTNQVQVHEHGLTHREALMNATVRGAMPKLPTQARGEILVPTATMLPPGMVIIYVSPATATAMAINN